MNKILKNLINSKKNIWNILKIDPMAKVFKFIDKQIGGGMMFLNSLVALVS